VHSDLLHFNVLVDDARVTAVIDWGSSLYGDFLYDIAWLCFFAPWYPEWRRIDFRTEAARYWASIGVELEQFDARIDCYQLHIGLDEQAYCAFTGRFDELARTAELTLKIARGLR
jgi:hygromycin-B 4-O-kinase